MTEGHSPREGDRRPGPPPATGPGRGDEASARQIRMVAPLADDDEAEGGDPVCWAHLVCDECGAITTEGHREGCPAAAAR